MSRPTILTVDDDPQVSAAITRDLAGQYGAEYRIVRASSGPEALTALSTLNLRDEPVALIAADQRMPQMTGIEMLKQSRAYAPGAKLLLLTAYADTDVAINAINDIGLDYYLLKPWDPPEERLYPIVDDLLDDWRKANPDHSSDVRVIGHRWSDRSHEIKMFLARNHVPYRWYDVERDAEGERLRMLAKAVPEDLPLVLVPDGETLQSPSTLSLAAALGLHTNAQQPLYDLCIVGGGPAGLAAAVYGASEGLSTVIVEREAPGGQAGMSSAIENYLGFPKGLSGSDLAHRAIAQVSRFGAEMVLARDVVGFETRGPARAVLFDGSGEIESRALVVATGVSYRRLEATGLAELTGRGVYYGSATTEAPACADQDVYVIGGANSAGQAAVFFSRYARWVTLLVRGDSLARSMSHYLIQQLAALGNVTVRTCTEVAGVQGDQHLEELILRHTRSGATDTVPTGHLFVFIGAAPRTDWLDGVVARDTRGFIRTGPDLLVDGRRPAGWPLDRDPYYLECNVPGVFVAGDVRAESVKRVASAVGEGAMAVTLVHRYLEDQ
jgi:thioredoxin reductase (NADPH)